MDGQRSGVLRPTFAGGEREVIPRFPHRGGGVLVERAARAAPGGAEAGRAPRVDGVERERRREVPRGGGAVVQVEIAHERLGEAPGLLVARVLQYLGRLLAER